MDELWIEGWMDQSNLLLLCSPFFSHRTDGDERGRHRFEVSICLQLASK
jgi:hypothetical protein